MKKRGRGLSGSFVGLPTLYPDHEREYAMWSREEREILRKCDRYLRYIKRNPPNVIGWLKGKVDSERMLALKAEIERSRNA